jgi:hypothetical protein
LRRVAGLILFLVYILASSGCAPVIVSKVITDDARAATRDQFILRYRAMNKARLDQGLDTLDFCSEAYWFDRVWTKGYSHDCTARAWRWERGDSTALNLPGMASSRLRIGMPEELARAWEVEQFRLRGMGAPRAAGE